MRWTEVAGGVGDTGEFQQDPLTTQESSTGNRACLGKGMGVTHEQKRPAQEDPSTEEVFHSSKSHPDLTDVNAIDRWYWIVFFHSLSLFNGFTGCTMLTEWLYLIFQRLHLTLSEILLCLSKFYTCTHTHRHTHTQIHIYIRNCIYMWTSQHIYKIHVYMRMYVYVYTHRCKVPMCMSDKYTYIYILQLWTIQSQDAY